MALFADFSGFDNTQRDYLQRKKENEAASRRRGSDAGNLVGSLFQNYQRNKAAELKKDFLDAWDQKELENDFD